MAAGRKGGVLVVNDDGWFARGELADLLIDFAETQCDRAGLTNEDDAQMLAEAEKDAEFWKRLEALRVRRVVCSRADANAFAQIVWDAMKAGERRKKAIWGACPACERGLG